MRYMQFPWRWNLLWTLAAAWMGAWFLQSLRQGRVTRRHLLVVAPLCLGVGVVAAVLAGPGPHPIQGGCLPSSVNLLLMVAFLILGVVLSGQSKPVQQTAALLAIALAWCAGALVVGRTYVPEALPFHEWNRRVYLDYEASTWRWGMTGAAEYTPIWSPRRPTGNPGAIMTSPAADTRLIRQSAYRVEFDVRSKTSNAGQSVIVAYGTSYFPGWCAFVDGRPVRTYPGEAGQVTCAVPQGDHRVVVDFLDTPVRRWATVLCWAGLLALLAGCFWQVRGRGREKG